MYGNPNPYYSQNQMNVSNQTFKINPQVMTLVEPIIRSMTQYQQFIKVSPAYGMWNPMNSMNEAQKKKLEEQKKNCVHLIRNMENGELEPTLQEVDADRYKCRLCGRYIYKKFDKSATEKLQGAIDVLNMLAFFGLTLNIGAEQMSRIIYLKSAIPEMIQLVDILNKFVVEENNAVATSNEIGADSQGAIFQGNNILGFGI